MGRAAPRPAGSRCHAPARRPSWSPRRNTGTSASSSLRLPHRTPVKPSSMTSRSGRRRPRSASTSMTHDSNPASASASSIARSSAEYSAAGATMTTCAFLPGVTNRSRAASASSASARSRRRRPPPPAGTRAITGRAKAVSYRALVQQPAIEALEDGHRHGGEREAQDERDGGHERREARHGRGRHGSRPHELDAAGGHRLSGLELVQPRRERLALGRRLCRRVHALQSRARGRDRGADRVLRRLAPVGLVLRGHRRRDLGGAVGPRVARRDLDEVGRRLAGHRQARDQLLGGLGQLQLAPDRVGDGDARDQLRVGRHVALRVGRRRRAVGIEHPVHLVGELEEDLRRRLVVRLAEAAGRAGGQQREREHGRGGDPVPADGGQHAAEVLGGRGLGHDQFAPRPDSRTPSVRSSSCTSRQADQLVTYR